MHFYSEAIDKPTYLSYNNKVGRCYFTSARILRE